MQIKEKVTYHFVTRVGFCSKCSKAQKPTTGQTFLAYGSTAKQFFAGEVMHNGLWGYTPHTYKVYVKDEKILIQSACAMDGCGVGIEENEKGEKFLVTYEKSWSEPREVTIEQVKALINFKDSGLRV